jgi:hypothetical protein
MHDGVLIPSDDKTTVSGGHHLKELMTVDRKLYHAVHFKVNETDCIMYSETDGVLNSRATRLAGVSISGEAIIYLMGPTLFSSKSTAVQVEEMLCGVYSFPDKAADHYYCYECGDSPAQHISHMQKYDCSLCGGRKCDTHCKVDKIYTCSHCGQSELCIDCYAYEACCKPQS